MSRKNGERRRRFTVEEKATILRRHLGDKVPVADLCAEYHLQPSLFYTWQRQALERLAVALQAGPGRPGPDPALAAATARVTALETRVAQKDAVIAAVSEEYLALKKNTGAS